MPGYSPSSTYPFAVNFLLFCSQVYLMTVGDMFTYNGRIVVGFSVVALILAFIPYLAALPLGLNYWVTFCVLIVYGAFSGVA